MDGDLKKIVGQRLQLLRIEKNLTQEQMGEKLNLSTSAYCKIEYGETDLTLTRLNKIAEVFDIHPMELFSKINGTANFNNCQGVIGYTQHNETVNLGSSDELRELVKTNCRMLDILYKKVEELEKRL